MFVSISGLLVLSGLGLWESGARRVLFLDQDCAECGPLWFVWMTRRNTHTHRHTDTHTDTHRERETHTESAEALGLDCCWCWSVTRET